MFALVCVPMCVTLTHACNAPPAADARSGVVPVGPGRRRDSSPTAKVLTRAAAKLQCLVGDAVGVRPAVTSVTTAASTARSEGRPRSLGSDRSVTQRSGSKAGPVQRRNVADAYSSALHTHSRGGNAQSARGLAAGASVTTSCRQWSSARSFRETRLSDVRRSDNVAPSKRSTQWFRETRLSEYSVTDSPGAQCLLFGRASEPSIELVRERRASCGNGVGNGVARVAAKRAAPRARQRLPDTEHVPLWRVAADLVLGTCVVVITAGSVLGVMAMYGQALQRSMAL